MYTAKGTSDKKSLVAEQTPLVKKLAHRLMAKLPASVDVGDLIQAGMIGLLDAISRFDPAQGAQFETFATQRIHGAMLDELRQNDWLPRSMRQSMKKIETAMATLQQRLGRCPNESEIAQQLKVPLSEYQELLAENGGHQLLYIEDLSSEDGAEGFLDRFASDSAADPLQVLMETDFRDALIEAIGELPEREKLLMGLYYEKEMNLKEIGAIMGVSESRVSQLHSQSVSRVRASLKGKAWTAPA